MHYYECFCLSDHFQLASEIATIWHSITIQGRREDHRKHEASDFIERQKFTRTVPA